jgi:hypothetical protein
MFLVGAFMLMPASTASVAGLYKQALYECVAFASTSKQCYGEYE